MATRFYFGQGAMDETPPAHSTVWDLTGHETFEYKIVKTKTSGAAIQKAHWDLSPALTGYCLMVRFMSGQLEDYEWDSDDTVKAQCYVREDTPTSGHTHFWMVGRVVSGDGTEVRGELFSSGSATANERSDYSNRNIGGSVACSTVSQQNGDRILVELGFYMDAYTATGWISSNRIQWHDNNAGDVAENETSGDIGPDPWIEFSPTIADYSAAATNIMLNII